MFKKVVGLLFVLMLTLGMSTVVFASELIDSDNPFVRMGLDVFVGDDAPVVAMQERSELPFRICDDSGWAFGCSSDLTVLRMASISRLSECAEVVITDADLDLLLEFVADAVFNRGVPVSFDSSFDDALVETGLYEEFQTGLARMLYEDFQTRLARMYIDNSIAPLNARPIMVSLPHGTWTADFGYILTRSHRVNFNLTWMNFSTIEVGVVDLPAGIIWVAAIHTGTSASGSFMARDNTFFAVHHPFNSPAFGIFLTGSWTPILPMPA